MQGLVGLARGSRPPRPHGRRREALGPRREPPPSSQAAPCRGCRRRVRTGQPPPQARRGRRAASACAVQARPGRRDAYFSPSRRGLGTRPGPAAPGARRAAASVRRQARLQVRRGDAGSRARAGLIGEPRGLRLGRGCRAPPSGAPGAGEATALRRQRHRRGARGPSLPVPAPEEPGPAPHAGLAVSPAPGRRSRRSPGDPGAPGQGDSCPWASRKERGERGARGAQPAGKPGRPAAHPRPRLRALQTSVGQTSPRTACLKQE